MVFKNKVRKRNNILFIINKTARYICSIFIINIVRYIIIIFVIKIIVNYKKFVWGSIFYFIMNFYFIRKEMKVLKKIYIIYMKIKMIWFCNCNFVI